MTPIRFAVELTEDEAEGIHAALHGWRFSEDKTTRRAIDKIVRAMNDATTHVSMCGTTGSYAIDGREYCACGSLANPAGYCCEHGTPITVGIA